MSSQIADYPIHDVTQRLVVEGRRRTPFPPSFNSSAHKPWSRRKTRRRTRRSHQHPPQTMQQRPRPMFLLLPWFLLPPRSALSCSLIFAIWLTFAHSTSPRTRRSAGRASTRSLKARSAPLSLQCVYCAIHLILLAVLIFFIADLTHFIRRSR